MLLSQPCRVAGEERVHQEQGENFRRGCEHFRLVIMHKMVRKLAMKWVAVSWMNLREEAMFSLVSTK